MIGPNGTIFLISVLSALIYSGQVDVVVQKINEILHWKLGCNPINSISSVSLHYFAGRGRGEALRLLMTDHSIPFLETYYTLDEMSWPAAKLYGIEEGLYLFGDIPTIETNKGVQLSKRKSILHYIGRSVGLDCDCRQIDWCDMVATVTDELRGTLERDVLAHPNLNSTIRDHYAKGAMTEIFWYFERIAPSGERMYFSKERLTWIDYAIFDMLESNCALLDLDFGIRLPEHSNCSEVFYKFPKLQLFRDMFTQRRNINNYINSTTRFKFIEPFW